MCGNIIVQGHIDVTKVVMIFPDLRHIDSDDSVSKVNSRHGTMNSDDLGLDPSSVSSAMLDFARINFIVPDFLTNFKRSI